jgi:adenine deaminase
MHILVREGSAAKNYEALAELLRINPGKVMFCSDDKHPDELLLHHINHLVKRSLQKGYDLFDVLRAASVNPVTHYKLPVGLLRSGDPADFIVIDNLDDLNVLQTWISGKLAAENGQSLLPDIDAEPINNFDTRKREATEFAVAAPGPSATIRVIEAIEGQLVTNELQTPARIMDGFIVSDTDNDILKMAVINRYQPDAPVALAFIKNIGLQRGALATTVGHDCHNIIVVGVDDASMCAAVNALVEASGGIAVAVTEDEVHCMPLPVAGLMTTKSGQEAAAAYTHIDTMAKELGTPLHAPFMTLSFMALLVIPSLKLSDKGLFDGNKFQFTSLVV